jgi:hypothetical protein
MAMNGGGNSQQQNCILEICCGGANSKQKQALTEVAQHALTFLSNEEAGEIADWIIRNWDLAPKGTLYNFKQVIAKLAKGPAYTD